jgi:dihydroxy-acid dehydratase
VPGALIAAARHNRPTIMIYGGTIQPGKRHLDCPAMVSCFRLHILSRSQPGTMALIGDMLQGFKAGDTVNIADAFESWGQSISISIGKAHLPTLLD